MNLFFERGRSWRLERFPASPFSCWFRVGRPNHGHGERPHGWTNQILSPEPFREEEKTTSGTRRRLELQLRKCGGVKKGKEEEIP